MRMLRYAILGLVGRAPMTGYDIKKNFESTFSKFWSAKHSQIYPELNALQRDGLVTCSIVIQGEKLEKKYYTITPSGRQALIDWLKSNASIEPVQKDEFRLKLYFGDYLSGRDEMMPTVIHQYRMYERRLAENTARIAELSDPPPEMGSPAFSEYMLGRCGILRDQAYLKWLRECAALLEIPLEELTSASDPE